MSKLKDILSRITKYYQTTGATEEDVLLSEKKLQLTFSDEYKEYLKEYGSISFNNHEIMGLNIEDYGNVVFQTLRERENDNNFPPQSYVIENLGIEGILVLENQDGEVYEYRKNHALVLLAKSFLEYIEKLI